MADKPNTETPDLLALLKKLEWKYVIIEQGVNIQICNCCGKPKPLGHAEDCELAAAIKEASKPAQNEDKFTVATIQTALNPSNHLVRHVFLHCALDELIADFIAHTDKLPSNTTLRELMEWSHKQTIEPEE